MKSLTNLRLKTKKSQIDDLARSNKLIQSFDLGQALDFYLCDNKEQLELARNYFAKLSKFYAMGASRKLVLENINRLLALLFLGKMNELVKYEEKLPDTSPVFKTQYYSTICAEVADQFDSPQYLLDECGVYSFHLSHIDWEVFISSEEAPIVDPEEVSQETNVVEESQPASEPAAKLDSDANQYGYSKFMKDYQADNSFIPASVKTHLAITATATAAPTPTSHLSKGYTTCPQFDRSTILFEAVGSDGEVYSIWASDPRVPECQNDIDCTTDPEKCTPKVALKMFPNNFIRVRPDIFYNPEVAEKLNWEFDKELGAIPRIEGFTTEEVRRNIIEYPVLDGAYRGYDPDNIFEYYQFQKAIEVDGALHDTDGVWDTIPDLQGLPKLARVAQEVVIRRYLLEEEHQCPHVYRMFGSFGKFMTLFAPHSWYSAQGYNNPIYLGYQCIKNRQLFYKTRNPIVNIQLWDNGAYVKLNHLP